MNIPAVRTLGTVTPDVFVNDVLANGQPVLLKGLVAAWPAVHQGIASSDSIAAYIKAMDSGHPTSVLEANPAVQGRFAYGPDMHDFNFNTRSKSISAAIDQLIGLIDHPNPPYVYIQSALIHQYLPRFLAENPNPILPRTIAPRIWISNATRAQTHNDNDHNLACVVAGRRRFTLFPPEQLVNLYIGPHDHTPSGRAISLASLEEPDFTTHPKFAEALKTAQVAEMEPGDALYVPKYWWHHVQSLERFNILVNYWWGGEATGMENPVTAFIAGLVAIKDMSPADKSYWKTMFDHYVFQTDGDPVAHIPRQHQGGLGKHSPQTRAAMIRGVQQMIMGKG